ncbi:MAG: HEPN domain-containing protein [Candidatus Symbiobacter sp.]|nr:HEPN domain-containing protein [Candidatus Symbiobacter sp.]
MSALILFKDAWDRCNHVSALHSFLTNNYSTALQPDELLRWEWVARVSALDLYFHEIILDRMVMIYLGKISPTDKFSDFKISLGTLGSMIDRADSTKFDVFVINTVKYFELEVREFLQGQTLQQPDKITEYLKYCTNIKFWEELVKENSALFVQETSEILPLSEKSRRVKAKLKEIVDRRNIIAHQADLQPPDTITTLEHTLLPINKSELQIVADFIENLVYSTDKLLNPNYV